jgi:hypothetical protein
MASNVNPDLPRDKALASKIIENQNELKLRESEKGWIGSLWGSSKNAPNNIAGIVILLLLTFGLVCTSIIVIWYPTKDVSPSIKDLWAVITPIITLGLGYLFGKKSSTDD